MSTPVMGNAPVSGYASKRAQLRVAGLWTSPNPYSAPEGSMRTFNNVVVSEGGLIRCRRGRTSALTVSGGQISKMLPIGNSILYFTTGGAIRSYHEPTTSAITAATGISPPAGKRFSVARGNQFIYLTTSNGVMRMTGPDVAPTMAGLPIPPGFDNDHTTLSLSGSTMFLPNGKNVAYVCLFGYRFRDTGAVYEGQTQYGPVSGMLTVHNNAGGARSVQVRVLLPFKNNTTSALDPETYFVQLYRTTVADDAPGGQMFLCAEQFLTSTDISNGYVDVLDDTGDGLLGEDLYTNTNKAGDQNTNFPPPFANQLVHFKDHMVYLNCQYRQRLEISLLSTDTASGGLANGDDLIIGSDTYTAKNVPAGAGEYKRYEIGGTNDLGSIALNIEATAQALCKAINADGSYYAYYSSKDSDLERGKITIMGVTDNDVMFGVGSSLARSYFAPEIPKDGTGMSLHSAAAGGQNYIATSRQFFPEAVPPYTLAPIGTEAEIIKGIVADDALWIFKRDGLWVMTGDSITNFSISSVDPTFRLLSPEAVAVIGGDLYALGHGGLHIITKQGAKPVSAPIKDELNATIYNVAGLSKVYDMAVLTAYESEKLLVLSLPQTSTSINCEKQYVYHTESGIWSTWEMPLNSACVSEYSDKLVTGKYLGAISNDSYLCFERKSGTTGPGGDVDFQDEGGIAIPVAIEWLPQALGTLSNQKRFLRASFLLTEQPSISMQFFTEIQDGTEFTIDSLGVGMANTLIDTPRGASLSVSLSCDVLAQLFELAATEIEFYEYEGRTR